MQGFFDKVYQIARLIPPGKVTSYGAIARMLGQPGAARTVGWALHSLPEGSDVPWHRVVNARGAVSARPVDTWGGLQRALLEDEGVEFDENGCVDWNRFGWEGLSPDEASRVEAGIAERS